MLTIITKHRDGTETKYIVEDDAVLAELDALKKSQRAMMGTIERLEVHLLTVRKNQKEAALMASDQSASVNLRLDDLDTKTNEAGERLKQIAAAIKPGMTDAEVEQVNTRIQTEADRLATWGTDPASPIP